MEGAAPVIQLEGVSKSFAGVTALGDVDLDLRAGEVHALVGENGAGKSTLVKVLAGVYPPDRGTVRVAGEETTLRSPKDARELGIAVIYQQPALFPDLDVAENVFMGRHRTGRGGRVLWAELYRDVQAVLDGLGVSLSARAPVKGLSVADQQLVEITRALSFDARVLIMDEPTAALSSKEVEQLFGIVRRLRGEGVAVLFVSHRLEEVFALADRVSVLRDGRHVTTAPTSELSTEDVIKAMVGRELDELFPKESAEIGETVLEVSGLSRAGAFEDVGFELRKGEILGLAGLVGAGRTEVARALFGVDRPDAGEIRLAGVPVTAHSPAGAMEHGFAYVPEDRHEHGLVLEFTVKANESLSILRRLSRYGMLDRTREEEVASEYSKRFDVRATGLDQLAGTLSGGNQQKVVLAKWLATGPRVLILDEPTQGIDIGTKAEVHRIVSGLAAEGMAILLISSDLPEILAMADRIVVMREGRVTGTFDREEADQETIMRAATGQVEHAA